jgi:hypothetical protein
MELKNMKNDVKKEVTINSKMFQRIINYQGIGKNDILVFFKLIEFSSNKFDGKFCRVNVGEVAQKFNITYNTLYRGIRNLWKCGLLLPVKYFNTYIVFFTDVEFDNFKQYLDSVTIKYEFNINENSKKIICDNLENTRQFSLKPPKCQKMANDDKLEMSVDDIGCNENVES